MTEWLTGKEVSSWSELRDQFETYLEKKDAEWVFRGQSREDWELTTKIERLRERFEVDWNALPKHESRLLREFQRRAHIYHHALPDKGDDVAWLALLRHHGGPTRLLDVTYSPFVATYFALEGADRHTDSAVWAIDKKWVYDQAKRVADQNNLCKYFDSFSRDRDGKSFRQLFMRVPPLRFVRGMNPKQLNERLTLQQGSFLCPGDLTASFEENLKELAKNEDSSDYIHKIVIGNQCGQDFLFRLRKMNIDKTTLFPGLDGFAQSLNTRFVEIGEMPFIPKGV